MYTIYLRSIPKKQTHIQKFGIPIPLILNVLFLTYAVYILRAEKSDTLFSCMHVDTRDKVW